MFPQFFGSRHQKHANTHAPRPQSTRPKGSLPLRGSSAAPSSSVLRTSTSVKALKPQRKPQQTLVSSLHVPSGQPHGHRRQPHVGLLAATRRRVASGGGTPNSVGRQSGMGRQIPSENEAYQCNEGKLKQTQIGQQAEARKPPDTKAEPNPEVKP